MLFFFKIVFNFYILFLFIKILLRLLCIKFLNPAINLSNGYGVSRNLHRMLAKTAQKQTDPELCYGVWIFISFVKYHVPV